jgi:tetratricopeptide (TPR) repeat protein
MRYFLFIFLFFFSLQFYGQEQELAFQYFRNGSYEKAAAVFKNLHKKHPFNSNYLNYLLDCYQQLENFEDASSIIHNQLENFPNQEYLYVELGYIYQLQHLQEEAIPFYEKALKAIENSPNLGYLIGKSFQDNHLLDYALRAYNKGMKLNPNANYNFQIARIYGEKADIANMFNTYLNMVEQNEKYLPTAKNYIGKFINEDSENKHNISLKRLLIKRLQNNPQNSWNQLLSWLYIQQKEYDKAFIQEKALHKRNSNDLNNILDLGKIAFENKNFEAAKSCFNYVLDNSPDTESILHAKLFLLEIAIETNTETVAIEDQFQQLFTQYGKNENTIGVQLAYADYLAFQKNDQDKAIRVLKDALKLSVNEFQVGLLKIKLADIFAFTNKFSSALIYYTQVQTSLKNHTIGQTARFKIAQTSYFKGDFEWAQSQLKILKNSTSQLIANDALDLNLLITDNAVKDSLKHALKKYAVADLLSFQHKNQEAIDTLQVLLYQYKGHPIEDEALFKQAQLFEKLQQFERAENNYLQLIKINKDDILVDDAHYFLAELYLNKFSNIEKAKEYYQKIIFDYPSSIYLVEARKKFRKLRGDDLN